MIMKRDWHGKPSIFFEVEDATPFQKSFPSKIDSRKLFCLRQTHGSRLWSTKDLQGLKEKPEGDAIWTREPGLAVGVFVADCTAAMMTGLDDQGQAVALAIHAGWRGTAEGILEKSIAALNLREVTCWLSPSICGEHYEVEKEVIEGLGEDARAFAPQNERGRFQLDLKAYQKQKLEKWGVQVESSPLCTWHQNEMISYRESKGSLQGRHLAWMLIEA